MSDNIVYYAPYYFNDRKNLKPLLTKGAYTEFNLLNLYVEILVRDVGAPGIGVVPWERVQEQVPYDFPITQAATLLERSPYEYPIEWVSALLTAIENSFHSYACM